MQFLCCFTENILRGLLLGICLDINLPQVFIQLRQCQLYGGFRRVNIYRRQLFPNGGARRTKLAGKHKCHQLCQHAILGPKNILKTAVGYLRLLYDLRYRCFFIALLQKQLDTNRQYPPFRRQACICQGHENHSSLACGTCAIIILYFCKKFNKKILQFNILWHELNIICPAYLFRNLYVDKSTISVL